MSKHDNRASAKRDKEERAGDDAADSGEPMKGKAYAKKWNGCTASGEAATVVVHKA
jgi:hypothetical protein